MKKLKLTLIASVLFSAALFSSCMFNTDERTELQFLESHYSGSFSNKRSAKINSRHLGTYLEDKNIKVFYSSKLKTDIMVYDNTSDSDFFDTDHEFYSNYLFIKYKNVLPQKAKAVIEKDFSNVTVAYDYQWLFTDLCEKDSDIETRLIEEIRRKNMYIIIQPDATEALDFDIRIKSVSTRLSNAGYIGNKYFFITDSAVSPQDFSNSSVDDIYEADKNSSFVKKYSSESYSTQLKEVE